MFVSLGLYSTYTCMYATKINEKRGHEFEREHGRVDGQI